MSAALAVWSVRVEPGKKASLTAQSDIRISVAALDAELKDQSARSSVKLTYVTPQSIDEDEDEEESLPPTTSTILCSLTPGKIEHAPLDLVINEDDEVEFEVIGKNVIYLSGNYITQPMDFPADEDDSDGDLNDTDYDSEVDTAELDEMEHDIEQDDSHRFEEIKTDDEKEAQRAEESSSKKRPRESDAGESGIGGEQKLSKKQLKKLNKKLKAENGEAVPGGGSKEEESKKDVTKGEKKEKDAKKEKKDEKKKSTENGAQKKKGELKETPGGLKMKDVKVGNGKAAKKGDLVSIRYIGKFMDGKVFDSNVKPKEKPLRFRLGRGEVIKGWDEGIVGMQTGGERLLIIPPNLGYGSRKQDGIPANSTLRFDCKLLAIK
ncbi:FKBP-like protein [Sanghuangporus baumii]|uniref:FK506-binding protein n=1 Tax=Sanghuangporus baumii TaxID=108892 RepID=A0A9Q5HVM5_SANBA|nr:FKBP-like protein [Sanghuangporus baumii]